MSAPNRSLLSRVRERDTQLAFVQLLQTSPAFRDWVIGQLAPEIQQAEFLSVSHSVVDYFGETDIEIRLRDEAGGDHFILVECKIDASFLPDQIERYHKRGDKYCEKGFCEDFSVGLLAPEEYVSDTDSFDGVITFEQILQQLDGLSHDGSPFFSTLFKKASAKEAGTEKGSVIDRIDSHLQERIDEFSQLGEGEQVANLIDMDSTENRVRVYSNHPDHPDDIRYETRFYPDEGTLVCGIGVFSAPDELHGRVYDVLAEHFEQLDLEEAQTELSNRRLKSQGLVKKTIPVPADPDEITEIQVSEAATAVIELINHYHPEIVEEFR